MHHPFCFFSAGRFFPCFPLLLAVVLAADGPSPKAGPSDGATAHFEQAETLRFRAAFADAAREFDAAASSFAARRTHEKSDLEWAFCARCGEAEMLLRAHKAKEARAVLEPLLKDSRLADSSYHGLALFYHGTACSRLGDDMAAGRSLDRLAPFDDADFGGAARGLLARVHERAGERAEALAQYEAVIADYAERKKAGLKGPTPDVVNQARFAAAVLHYENG